MVKNQQQLIHLEQLHPHQFQDSDKQHQRLPLAVSVLEQISLLPAATQVVLGQELPATLDSVGLVHSTQLLAHLVTKQRSLHLEGLDHLPTHSKPDLEHKISKQALVYKTNNRVNLKCKRKFGKNLLSSEPILILLHLFVILE